MIQAFEHDRRALLARLNEHKSLSLRRKQTVDWRAVGRDWDDYWDRFAGEEWREEFMPLFEGVTVDMNETWTSALGIQFNVRNLFAEMVLEFDAYALRFAQPIMETTEADLKQLLRTALEEGWTIDQMDRAIDILFEKYVDDIELTDEQRAWFEERLPRYRVEMIARTEAMKASNFGSQLLFQAYGATANEWIATMDNRVRPSHAAADGQVRPIGVPFEVGSSLMLYPLDGSLGAPAEEIVNCRCVLGPIIPEEGEL